MPTCAASSNWKDSRMSMLHSPECLQDAMSIRARSSMPAHGPPAANCLIWPESILCAFIPACPQAYAPYIKVGAKTFVTLQEFPGPKVRQPRWHELPNPLTPTLARYSPKSTYPTRMAVCLPGSFGEVHFAVGSNVNKVTVPVNTMLFRAEGAQVAVVGPDNKVQLRPISIGRDYGTTLEILGGVEPRRPDRRQPAGLARRRAAGERGATATEASRSPVKRRNQQKGGASVKRAALSAMLRAAGTSRRMHGRSALQPACGSSAGSRCVEDATALAAGRAQGFDS